MGRWQDCHLTAQSRPRRCDLSRWRMRRGQSSIGSMAWRVRSTILAGPLLACFGMHSSAAWADAGYRIALEVPGRHVTVLYAEESGDGPPLILLHGLGGSLFTWRHVVATLGRSHHVIALDLKGFGQSDKPFDEHYSEPTLIVWCRRDRIGGDRAPARARAAQRAARHSQQMQSSSAGRGARRPAIDATAVPRPLSKPAGTGGTIPDSGA
jgi:alpha/beta hydrolase fold